MKPRNRPTRGQKNIEKLTLSRLNFIHDLNLAFPDTARFNQVVKYLTNYSLFYKN